MKFIFFPDGSSKVHEFRISKLQVFLLYPMLLVGLVVGVAYAMNFLSDSIYTMRLRQLTQDRNNLASQLDELHEKSFELDQSVQRIFSLDDDLRNFADLPAMPESFRDVGVGGALSQPMETAPFFEYEAGGAFALLSNLEKFERLLELEVDSYEEITEKLHHQKELARHYPSIRPVKGGRLTDVYGMRNDPIDGSREHHEGLDIGVEMGTPIVATADGKIDFAAPFFTYGNMVIIDHNSRKFGFKTKYAHMQKILVKKGQQVKRGDVVGTVGATGRITGRHLHYEVLIDEKTVDPREFYVDPSILQ
jgi:murein DD-endopeptidase MepM/ murein hydrolase activator NlpD